MTAPQPCFEATTFGSDGMMTAAHLRRAVI
jgi:hypothetical protein